MNTNMKRMVRGLIVAAAAAGSSALAQEGGPMMGDPNALAYMPMGQMGHGGFGLGGHGMGMMGGGMMGHGGGMGPVWMLNLSDEQRKKIDKAYDEARRKNWETYGKIMDEHVKLRDLYARETVDAKKAGAVYGNISRLQQQIFETNIETRNRVYAVLSPDQKEQLKYWSRGGMGLGHGMGGPVGRGGLGVNP